MALKLFVDPDRGRGFAPVVGAGAIFTDSRIGTVIAITLLGWGIGGMIGGILADYIGRKRMMILAILA